MMLVTFAMAALPSFSATIRVPVDYTSIQDAIDAASSGDEIVVSPGTYTGQIDFSGKAIVIRGRDGAETTILDANQAGSVVTFANGEDATSILEGFTLTNGTGTEGQWGYFLGGGIYCLDSSPTINDNIIVENSATDGGGIFCRNSSPDMSSNTIRENTAFKGAGIYCTENSSPSIANTIIAQNSCDSHGAGICCWNGSSPVVTNSTISENSSNNEGGGIYCTMNSYPVVTNSILWNDTALEGPEIWIGHATHTSSLTISYSDVDGGQALAFVDANCTLNWGSGMIESDPLFAAPSAADFHLTTGSPCLDSGDNAAPSLPEFDFEGDSRITSGTVDMGADELYEPQTIAVPLDYITIQDAIDAALFRDTVRVASGTYFENIDFKGKAITIESVDGAASTTIDGMQNGSVVSFVSGEGVESVLSGFTITNGTGTLDVAISYGGGIYCDLASSPTITGNIITSNTAAYGAGISCTNDSCPKISSNTITYNNAQYGGGINGIGSIPAIENNNISHNDSVGNGGGIYLNNAPAEVEGNFFSYNDAQSGGAICTSSSDAFIRDNVMTLNTTFWNGAGIYCVYGTPKIVNNRIYENEALDGGGIAMIGSTPLIINNTIVMNVGLNRSGGIISYVGSSPTVVNTILWGNLATVGPEIVVGDAARPSSLTISHCCIEGGQASVHVDPNNTLNWGAGMIDGDPLFADSSLADFHITYNSSCRNTGDSGNMLFTLDFEGNPREAEGAVDMGADEFYPYLYHMGTVSPGILMRICIVGEPGTSPVTLARGAYVLDEPDQTSWGPLYLGNPIQRYGVGNIPANGVLMLDVRTPGSWQAGEEIPFQALLGSMTLPESSLTNLMVLEVE